MAGATLLEVKEILGHADIWMTLRYAHLSPAHLRGAVGRIDFRVPVIERVEAAAQAPSAHQLAHDARIDANRLVNSRAPVAQSDRARVS